MDLPKLSLNTSKVCKKFKGEFYWFFIIHYMAKKEENKCCYQQPPSLLFTSTRTTFKSALQLHFSIARWPSLLFWPLLYLPR